ncbi:RICIN domain-containing protein [Bacillus thuringiensis]|uniref:RICIN domain-containing protein n=1 Tax=Bacillus thuringiensis TaxID=1428 RepID=UPI001E5ED682|nr:RICIN domain-containing protein [Bacillus thuringiensis]MCC6082998.1 RICIN domain-containing protein [Bacillus thuringiensis]
MEIKKDVFYKLVNKNSGKVAAVKGNSLDDNAKMVQYKDYSQSSEEFLLFKLDNNCYVFANKNSGNVMAVDDGSSADDAKIVQYHWYADTDEEWSLVQEDSTYYKFKNNKSGKVLAVNSNSKDDNAYLVQYKDYIQDSELWTFKEMETISLPSKEIGVLPDVPQYTSLNDNLPDYTDSVITSYTLIPCIMIDDTWSLPDKIKDTPYYIMYKKQYWKKIDAHTFAPGASYESKTQYGMSETDQDSMTNTTGITVTADAGFSFSHLTSSISKTVTQELQVSQSTTTDKMVTQENDEIIPNNNDYEVAWSLYALVNEYYLERADGTIIGDSPWTVINKNDERESYYPLNVSLKNTTLEDEELQKN